jgi:peptidoglycan/xylan/chitin deacetylase (PgdA/CDA1 family)
MIASAVVPILEYHNIGSAPAGAGEAFLYVGEAALRTQLWLLRAARRRGVDMTTVARQLEAGGGRLVGITFDDAYRDILHNALPVLLDAGFTATCYAVSARLGKFNTWDADVLRTRKPLMSAVELREWAAAGMEVGAHTRTHARLTQCTAAQLDEEVARSRDELEQLLGRAVTHFCYPWGAHDERVVDAVRRAGFLTAVTTVRGRARPAHDALRLPRVPVRGDRSPYSLPLRVLTSYEDHRR